MKEPPPDAAADTPEKPWLFRECLKWTGSTGCPAAGSVMDDFFHGQVDGEGMGGSLGLDRQGQAHARWGMPPSMRNGEFSSDS
jgi:hypothetical protein